MYRRLRGCSILSLACSAVTCISGLKACAISNFVSALLFWISVEWNEYIDKSDVYASIAQ